MPTPTDLLNLEDAQTVLLGTPLVIGLVELAKGQGLPEKWAPAAAVVFGFAVTLLLSAEEPGSRRWLLIALVLGLTASGTYDHAKTIAAAMAGKEAAQDGPK